jgi:hypothetical protein
MDTGEGEGDVAVSSPIVQPLNTPANPTTNDKKTADDS